MSSLTVLAAFTGLATASPLFSSYDPFSLFSNDASISSGCSTTSTASCHNTSAIANTCCTESPGGLLIQTQFWDTDPTTGPSDSWTIHGLWPDHCDQTFDESCDPSRAYTDIASLLTAQGASDTLSYMQTYWKDINGKDETFWEHEWSTHGTCMSTLEPSCLPSGSPAKAEAAAFFQTVVKLFKTLPTYTWLANQGITPSNSATHTSSSLASALKAEAGVTPGLDCDGSNLNQIYWYFNLKGSIIDGTFVAIDAPVSGSCPSSGIKYLIKSGGSSTTTTKTTTSTTTTKSTSTTTSTTTGGGSSPTLLPSKGTIHVVQSGSQTGGLLSAGTWSTQTLATFTFSGSTSSFTMTSSKGNCGVSGGVLSCGSSVTSTSFSSVSSGGLLLLASGGSTAFTSSGTPSGTTVETIKTGSSLTQDYVLSIVSS